MVGDSQDNGRQEVSGTKWKRRVLVSQGQLRFMGRELSPESHRCLCPALCMGDLPHASFTPPPSHSASQWPGTALSQLSAPQHSCQQPISEDLLGSWRAAAGRPDLPVPL